MPRGVSSATIAMRCAAASTAWWKSPSCVRWASSASVATSVECPLRTTSGFGAGPSPCSIEQLPASDHDRLGELMIRHAKVCGERVDAGTVDVVRGAAPVPLPDAGHTAAVCAHTLMQCSDLQQAVTRSLQFHRVG